MNECHQRPPVTARPQAESLDKLATALDATPDMRSHERDLERDAEKWFRPVKGQFLIYYRHGTEQPEYVPDFVAETSDVIYMVETKARSDIGDSEVKAKAEAAIQWCRHASDYAKKYSGKSWKYLLIPHDEVNESRHVKDYARFEKVPP